MEEFLPFSKVAKNLLPYYSEMFLWWPKISTNDHNWSYCCFISLLLLPITKIEQLLKVQEGVCTGKII